MITRFFKGKSKLFFLGILAGVLLTSTIVYAADAIRIVVDGKKIESDVPPQIIDGRVMVPIRTISEELGSNVHWDEANRTVVIDTSQQSSPIGIIEEQIINQTAPDRKMNLEKADDGQIISFIQQVEDWRRSVLTTPRKLGEWNITSEQRQLMYLNLGQLLNTSIIDRYFNIHYAEEEDGYRTLEVDVTHLPEGWDEYNVTVEPLDVKRYRIHITAHLGDPGITHTHESIVRYDDELLFFESFKTYSD